MKSSKIYRILSSLSYVFLLSTLFIFSLTFVVLADSGEYERVTDNHGLTPNPGSWPCTSGHCEGTIGTMNDKWGNDPGGNLGKSGKPDISADGSMIVFQSDASAINANGVIQSGKYLQYDIWVYDSRNITFTKVTTVKSLLRGDPVFPEWVSPYDDIRGDHFFAQAIDPSISGDGSKVAYASNAQLVDTSIFTPDLMAYEASGRMEILVADISDIADIKYTHVATAHTADFINYFVDPTQPNAYHRRQSRSPDLNYDGSVVVFNSNVDFTDIISGYYPRCDTANDIYLYNLNTKVYTKATETDGNICASNDGGPAHRHLDPQISPDGTRVVFHSGYDYDTGTAPTDIDRTEIYLWDGTLHRLTTGSGTNREAFGAKMSDDGSKIVFVSDGYPDGNYFVENNHHIWLCEQSNGSCTDFTRITPSAGFHANRNPNISSDGRFVTFESSIDFTGNESYSTFEVWVYDTESKSLQRATYSTGKLGVVPYQNFTVMNGYKTNSVDYPYHYQKSRTLPSETGDHFVFYDSYYTGHSELNSNGRTMIMASDGVYTPSTTYASGNAYNGLTDIWKFNTEPDLQIQKTALEYIAPNDTMTYTIVVTNHGTYQAEGVVITDTLPTSVTILGSAYTVTSVISLSGIAGNTQFNSITPTTTGNQIVWSYGELALGQLITLTVQVQISPTVISGTDLINNVEVRSTTPVTRGTNYITTSWTTKVQYPTFAITKTDSPDPVNIGDPLNYIITVTNDSPVFAEGVVITDMLNSLVDYDSSSNGGVYSSSVISWTAIDMDIGETVIQTIIVDVPTTVATGTVLNNYAYVDSTYNDTTFTDLATTTVHAASLELSISDNPDFVVNGHVLTYTITITNPSAVDAAGVIITSALDSNVTFVGASDSGGVISGTSVVSWTVATISNGSTPIERIVTVTVNLDVISGTTLVNTSGVTLSNGTGDSDSEDTTVRVPTIAVIKVASSNPVTATELLTYTIYVINTSSADATNLTITDTLDTNVNYVSGGSHNTGVVTWSKSLLAAGNHTIYTLTVTVTDVPSGTILTNELDAYSYERATAKHYLETTVHSTISAPVMRLTKLASPNPVLSGDTLTYTLIVTNVGSADGAITVTDVISTDLATIQSGDGGTPDYDVGTGVITWTDNLNKGGEVGVYTLTVMVNDDVLTGTTITNMADVTTTVGGIGDSDSVDVIVHGMPELVIDKTVSADPATAGKALTYTITITNIGTADSLGVTLEDTFDSDTTFNSASGTYGQMGNVISWTLNSLAMNTPMSYTLQVMVSNVLSGTTLTNMATVEAIEGMSATTSIDTDVEGALLSISKTDSADPVTVGDLLTYTITIENIGVADALNVVLTDTFDSNTTFSSADPTATPSGNDVVWNVGTLVVGESDIYTLVVTVNETGIITGNTVSNNAKIIADNATLKTVIESTTVYTIPEPILTISKSADSVVWAGDLLTYTITIENVGPGDATGVYITDTLPTNVTVSDDDGGTEGIGTVTWDIDTISSGVSVEKTLIVVVSDDVVTNTILSNLVSVTSTELSGASDSADTTVWKEEPQPDPPILNIINLESHDPVMVSDYLTYTIIISNSGASEATNVVIEDILDSNVTYSSSSNGGAHSVGTVTWNVATIDVDATISRTVSVIVNSDVVSGTMLSNTAEVTSTELAGDNITIQTTVYTEPVVTPPEPILTLTKTDDADPVFVGEALVYTLVVENSGEGDATGVILTDNLPDDVIFSEASDGGTHDGGIVTWVATTLDSGNSINRTITVVVNGDVISGTTIENTADVTSTEGVGDDVTETTLVYVEESVPPVLAITKDVDLSSAEPGDDLTYTITVNNTGGDATNVLITDTLPSSVTVVSTDGGTESNDMVTWSLASLAASGSEEFTLVVTVNNDVVSGTILTNVVETTCDDCAATVSDNAVTTITTTPTPLPPILSISKEASSETILAGEVLSYTITVVNSGGSAATNVVVVDTVPSYVTASSADETPTGGTLNNGEVTWYIDSLSESSSLEFTLVVTANEELISGTKIINSVTATADGDISASASVTTTVPEGIIAPILSLTKEANATVMAGELLTYTITVGVSGSADAENVEITDTLPANVTPSGTITLGLDTVSLGESVVRTIVVTVNDVATGTILTNMAIVNASNALDTASDSVDTTVYTETSITPPEKIDLAVTMSTSSADGAVGIDDIIMYTITVTNNGDGDATGITLVNTLDGQGSIDSALPTDVGDLADGDSTIKTMSVKATAVGTIINKVSVLANEEENDVIITTVVGDKAVKGTPGNDFSMTVELPGGGQIAITIIGGNIPENFTLVYTTVESEPTILPAGWMFFGTIFNLDAYQDGNEVPNYTLNGDGATIVINYIVPTLRTVEVNQDYIESSLQLKQLESGKWIDTTRIGEVDTETKVITSTTTQMGQYALFAETMKTIYLPIVLK